MDGVRAGWRLGGCAIGGLSALLGAGLFLGNRQQHYAAFAAATVTGGLTLVWLAVGRRRPGRAALVGWGLLTLAGMLGSLLIWREQVGCMFCYHRGQGYPWGWLDVGFDHPDMPTLRRAHEIMKADPDLADWSFDRPKALLDAVFWGYVALPVVVLAARVAPSLARIVGAGDRRVQPGGVPPGVELGPAAPGGPLGPGRDHQPGD